MKKLPSMQFYPSDWLRDPQLRMASASTRGLWIDLLCHMWNAPKRGVIEGTAEQIQRLLGCSETEFDTFLSEAEQLQFCDIERYEVTDRNAKITVANRRMVREENARNSNTIRQSRFRRAASNAKVTSPSSSSSSSASSEEEKQAKEERSQARSAKPAFQLRFEQEFIPLYPAHRRTQIKTALAVLRKLKPDADWWTAALGRLEAWKASEDWTRDEGAYVPGIGNFLTEPKYQVPPQSRASPRNQLPRFDQYWEATGEQATGQGK